jgi:2-dehydro-3-deoxygalactonokinase
MASASFIAGDWGTSHLRLSLCDEQGGVIDSRDGPGAGAIEISGGGGRSQAFAQTFASLTVQWQESHGILPAVLCGMVGSSIGWTQAPYVACPAQPAQIINACVTLCDAPVRIIPGLSCRNRLDAPDYLRGEETQILGALQLTPALHRGRWLLCLPGTHTKWVLIEDGVVREFLTALTGEIFAVLCAHSVLVRKSADDPDVFDMVAFGEGLARFGTFPHAQLLHRLFESRSRQLAEKLKACAADAFLSGLLIGCDVEGALRLLDVQTLPTVYLIGSARLTRLYAAALRTRACEPVEIAGAAASQAGLTQVHRGASELVALHG